MKKIIGENAVHNPILLYMQLWNEHYLGKYKFFFKKFIFLVFLLLFFTVIPIFPLCPPPPIPSPQTPTVNSHGLISRNPIIQWPWEKLKKFTKNIFQETNGNYIVLYMNSFTFYRRDHYHVQYFNSTRKSLYCIT